MPAAPMDTGHPSLIMPRSKRHDGFALLVTIVLVAFLVLILVGLASFTRIETQVASNTQQQAQARQNALMALNIAVGQLQKYAGPDQRVTARADLQNTPGQPNSHWVGVYGSSLAADYGDTPGTIQTALSSSANVDSRGSSARLLNWLVSGNERTDFDPRRNAGDVGASGNITGSPAASIHFLPAASTSGLGVNTLATDTGIRVTNASGTAIAARLLVGANSVSSGLDSSGRPADYVAAPAIPIMASPATVPGMDPAGSDVTIGRYAWWVGDEGVKARINLPLAGTDAGLTAAEQLEEKRRAFVNAPRTALELMSRAPSLPAPALDAARIATLFAANHDGLARVVSPSQAFLASGAPADFAAVLKNRFHDISTASRTVLSDTYAGGLRQDLTRILPSAGTGPTNATRLWTPDITTEDTTFNPTWGHLRSFHAATASGGVITPQLPVYGGGTTAGTMGVSPLLTYVGMGYRYAAGIAADGGAIHFNIHPVVVLWNPYDKRMAAQTYEVGMGYLSPNPRILLQVNDVDLSEPSPPNNWQTREIRDLRYAGKVVAATDSTDQPLEYFRFRIQCPVLEPGESRVFTLGTSSSAYSPGGNTLLPGLNPHHYATLTSSTILPGEAEKDFRVIGQGGLNSQHHLAAYLGDGTAPPVTTTGYWDPAFNRWYQVIQRVDYPNINVENRTGAGDTPANAAIFGDAEPLQEANPVLNPQLKTVLMSIFSATGKGYTIYNEWGLNIPRYRWIAQANIRAPYQFRSRRDPNMNTPWYGKVGSLDTMWPTWYMQSPSNPERASSGLGMDYDLNTGDVIDAKLFEIRDASEPLLSIGRLQHANLSLASAYPSYAVGNSIADFRLPDTSKIVVSTGAAAVDISNRLNRYYDASWLLNRTLWDRYYFSGVRADGVFENPRHEIYPADDATDAQIATDLQDHRRAAARLLLTGGFNVNSTSEQAWRAVLGGVNLLAYDPEASNGAGANSSTPTTAAFPRFSRPRGGTGLPSNVASDTGFNSGESQYAWYRGNDMQSLWEGYRILDENQIAQLARNMVEEVRARGPFISLGDFVNRRLIDNTAYLDNGPNDQYRNRVRKGLTQEQRRIFLNTLKGALQAAIDATYEPAAGAFPINERGNNSYWRNNRSMGSLQAGDTSYYSLALARGDLNDDSHNETAQITPSRSTAAFAPKYLTQADILSTIGASLSARSDTFTIRTYGEVVNPVLAATDPNYITGRAWCEAVVQRLPDYVDSDSDPAETAPADLTSDQNRTFGRKFQIVSFRWLSPHDI